MSEASFDPLAPSFRADSYGAYRVLRDRPTAAFSEILGGWLFTRYDDVALALHDPETFSSDDNSRVAPRKTVIDSDPPEHGRLRRVVSHAFSARMTAIQEARIREHVEALLERAIENGCLELMEGLAIPLPLLVLSDVLGLSPSDGPRLRRFAESEIIKITPRTTEEERARLESTTDEMHAFCRDLAGDDDLRGFVALLLRAGTITITHLIGNSVLALVQKRAAIEMLRSQPERMDSAIDELLRHSGPIQSIPRIVKRSVTLHGVDLKPGDRVNLVLASANRDERKFDDPDHLRIDREASDHLGLGGGIHYCLGARLGRLEAKIAIDGVLARMPKIARIDLLREPDWAFTWAIRGLRSLWLRGAR